MARYLPYPELRDEHDRLDASRLGDDDLDGVAPRASGAAPRAPFRLATIDFTCGARAPQRGLEGDEVALCPCHGGERARDLPSDPWVPSANPHAGPRHWSVLPRARVLSARDAVVYASAGDEATFFFLHALEELVGREMPEGVPNVRAHVVARPMPPVAEDGAAVTLSVISH